MSRPKPSSAPTRRRIALVAAGLVCLVGAAVAHAAFSFKPAKTYDATGTSLYPVAIADLNGDGRKDIAVGSEDVDTVSILDGKKGGFRAPKDIQLPSGSYPFWIATGDLNGDHRTDMVVADDKTGKVSVVLAKHGGGFKDPKGVSMGPSDAELYQVVIADFNHDGKPDIATANYAAGDVAVRLGRGDGTFRARKTLKLNETTSPVALVAHDFNSDGTTDLAVLTQPAQPVKAPHATVDLLRGKGDGRFKKAQSFNAGASSPYGMVAANFDSDNHLDLAVADCPAPEGSVYLLHGDGHGFKAPKSFPDGFGSCAYEPAATDLNGDGRTDLVTESGAFGDAIVHYGKKGGKLSGPQTFPAVEQAYSGAIANLNGDGLPDLVVPDYQNPDVAVLYGKK